MAETFKQIVTSINDHLTVYTGDDPSYRHRLKKAFTHDELETLIEEAKTKDPKAYKHALEVIDGGIQAFQRRKEALEEIIASLQDVQSTTREIQTGRVFVVRNAELIREAKERNKFDFADMNALVLKELPRIVTSEMEAEHKQQLLAADKTNIEEDETERQILFNRHLNMISMRDFISKLFISVNQRFRIIDVNVLHTTYVWRLRFHDIKIHKTLKTGSIFIRYDRPHKQFEYEITCDNAGQFNDEEKEELQKSMSKDSQKFWKKQFIKCQESDLSMGERLLLLATKLCELFGEEYWETYRTILITFVIIASFKCVISTACDNGQMYLDAFQIQHVMEPTLQETFDATEHGYYVDDEDEADEDQAAAEDAETEQRQRTMNEFFETEAQEGEDEEEGGEEADDDDGSKKRFNKKRNHHETEENKDKQNEENKKENDDDVDEENENDDEEEEETSMSTDQAKVEVELEHEVKSETEHEEETPNKHKKRKLQKADDSDSEE